MNNIRIRQRSKPFTAAIFLLVLVIITLAAVIGRTWASYSGNHTLTYTTNQLTWDGRTTVLSDGSAELTVFNSSYNNVQSQNGDKLIAPGTSGNDSIVLRNTVDRSISYTAIAYFIKNDLRIPVDMEFDGSDLSDTDNYSLPAGIDQDSVLRAVSGTLEGNSELEFDFSWNWTFETADLASDPLDTALGDDAAQGKDESVKVGFYIVVEDRGGGSDVDPEITPGKTGDDSNLWLYVFLVMCCLLIFFLLLLADDREERKDEEREDEYRKNEDRKDEERKNEERKDEDRKDRN